MPVLSTNDYCPSLLFRNGHINTLLSYYQYKSARTDYSRKRIDTPDGDFLDLDFIKTGSDKLCILSHGLEGSSRSSYIVSAASHLSDAGFDILAWNFRSCSGQLNRKLTMYHSGHTSDLDHVFQSVKPFYKEIILLGFSLGGNVILKYAGEKSDAIDPKIAAAIGISVPCDLSACSNSISRPENYVYERRFLRKLKKKIRQKSAMFPDLHINHLGRIRRIKDFDDYYTAPIHGFKNAEDYYRKSSCLYYLDNIRIPSLIINARDDSFLSENCYPVEICRNSRFVHLLAPKFGGHVGFRGFRKKTRWSDHKALEFLRSC